MEHDEQSLHALKAALEVSPDNVPLRKHLADPLCHLLLRLDRFGRYVFSKDERLGANLVGACLLGALVGITSSGFLNSGPLFAAGIGCLLLAIPCSAIPRCDQGWPRLAMIAYTLVLATSGALFVLGAILDSPGLRGFGVLFILGVFASSFVANALMSATVQH